MKVCNKCRLSLPLNHFSIAQNGRDGHRNECKKCKIRPARKKLGDGIFKEGERFYYVTTVKGKSYRRIYESLTKAKEDKAVYLQAKKDIEKHMYRIKKSRCVKGISCKANTYCVSTRVNGKLYTKTFNNIEQAKRDLNMYKWANKRIRDRRGMPGLKYNEETQTWKITVIVDKRKIYKNGFNSAMAAVRYVETQLGITY